nr:RNA-directed DNA polymerase, eukaryota [Tanacetum cinerariifolium]
MCTSISFSFRHPVRGGVESQQHDHLSVLLDSVILSNMEDKWFWDLDGDGVFRVKDVRILLDEAFLPKMEVPTRWIKSIPIKLNVFAWKLFLDRLPTRSNLARRNVSIPSLACLLPHSTIQLTPRVHKHPTCVIYEQSTNIQTIHHGPTTYTSSDYRDENTNLPFAQEDAWKILRMHAKWDASALAPVDLTEDEEITEVNTNELFGDDARTRPSSKQRPGKKTKSDASVSTGGSNSLSQFGKIMTKELRLKREAAEAEFEVAKEKDR